MSPRSNLVLFAARGPSIHDPADLDQAKEKHLGCSCFLDLTSNFAMLYSRFVRCKHTVADQQRASNEEPRNDVRVLAFFDATFLISDFYVPPN